MTTKKQVAEAAAIRTCTRCGHYGPEERFLEKTIRGKKKWRCRFRKSVCASQGRRLQKAGQK